MAFSFNGAPRKNFPDRKLIKICVLNTCNQFQKKVGELNYVFVSDEELLDMNKEYLNHDYYTDIITFDNSEDPDKLEGDIFISKDRVEENGVSIGNGVLNEYIRVMGHGLLHLCGLKDKFPAEIEEMRKAENAFLQLYHSLIGESNQNIKP